MQRQSYVRNAAILTATGLLLRAIGMFFRVYIAARIGAEGMGLYQLIYTVYTLAVTFATAGLSVAATRICAQLFAGGCPGKARRAMKSVLSLGCGLGFLAGMLLYAAAPWAAQLWLRDARALLPLRILAPSLPFMAMSAVWRGYFMAVREVRPNSIAQLFEQAVRIGVVACALHAVDAQDITRSCAAVVLGNTISEISSWCLMLAFYRASSKELPGPSKAVDGLWNQLWQILAPICANQYLTSALRSVENVMVPACLALFTLSRETALSQYGALKGMAMPVLFFPFSFLGTLSTLLMPEITEAYVQGRKRALRYLVNRVLLLTLALSILASGLYTVFAYDVAQVLYQSNEIGFYIAVLGPLTPFMYLESMVDGILKGLNEQLATFRYSVVDSLLRILLIALLLPRFGMKGFLFVMLVSNLLTSLLNWMRLLHVTELKVQWMRWIVKPVCAMAFSALVWNLLRPLIALPAIGRTLCGGVLITVLYVAALWAIGGIRGEDIWPAGRKNAKIMQKTVDINQWI